MAMSLVHTRQQAFIILRVSAFEAIATSRPHQDCAGFNVLPYQARGLGQAVACYLQQVACDNYPVCFAWQ